MATHIKIKTPENELIHFDTHINNYTLCDLETGGDNGLAISESVIVNRKVNCPDCIRIVKFCQSIKNSEFI